MCVCGVLYVRGVCVCVCVCGVCMCGVVRCVFVFVMCGVCMCGVVCVCVCVRVMCVMFMLCMCCVYACVCVCVVRSKQEPEFNPLNAVLNPICPLLALFGAHHILHVSRVRVNINLYYLFVHITVYNKQFIIQYARLRT